MEKEKGIVERFAQWTSIQQDMISTIVETMEEGLENVTFDYSELSKEEMAAALTEAFKQLTARVLS